MPKAAAISISETLSLLDGPKKTFAEGVANDQYVFWLGSGISRDKMPDLRNVAKHIISELQSRADVADPNCRFVKALDEVVSCANPSPEELGRIDYSDDVKDWVDLDALAARLVQNYARMLNVTVDGEEDDYLLWDVLRAQEIYADPNIDPDTEHLCLGVLAAEGVASEMPTANWDTLIETAIRKLVGDQPILRTVVAPDEIRQNRMRANVYKFHGCAGSALRAPNLYRSLLVARDNQINGWSANNRVMANCLRNLIVSKATLMIGLSAQDANIQQLFSEAEENMPWSWPSEPPAYVFSENALGFDQKSLLKNVYSQDYNAASRPLMVDEALFQAYAKPLLLSLVLYVLSAKLKLLVDLKLPQLEDNDRELLHAGLKKCRDLVASALSHEEPMASELIGQIGRTLTMFREGGLPLPANGIYAPLTTEPLERMPADPNLSASGLCEFAIATGLIGMGINKGLWTVEKADTASPDSGAFSVVGRSGPAKLYFVSNGRTATKLIYNGHVANNDDAILVHSHETTPRLARSPRRAPGRTGLSKLREVSIEELLEGGTDAEELLDGFRQKVAL
ncbi:SIR2 family protein [Ruegeria arenilitoris]|uniref:SIR2 family protein n=1 Tax=Ruegeria arenilitoris TaxID=1173585 RepID=UPI00147E9017|nr:SIR2 family protein [Ruegeria arenilitoris]